MNRKGLCTRNDGWLRCFNVARTTAEKLASSWVRTGDYLLDAHTIAADFVIGNPPYVRLEDIPEATAQFYRDAYPTMVGRADLYIAFFEAALRQLNEGAYALLSVPIAGCGTSTGRSCVS